MHYVLGHFLYFSVGGLITVYSPICLSVSIIWILSSSINFHCQSTFIIKQLSHLDLDFTNLLDLFEIQPFAGICNNILQKLKLFWEKNKLTFNNRSSLLTVMVFLEKFHFVSSVFIGEWWMFCGRTASDLGLNINNININ